MGELTIRRRMGVAVPQYQGTTKTEKKSGSSRSQATSRTTVTISETLRQLMSRVSQAEGHARESRRTLQAGEGALAGVQDSLERIAQLARQSAGGGQPDRAALQAELEGLRDEIDRILSSAVSGGTQLFLDEDAGADDGAEVLLYTLSGEPAPSEEAVQELPDWLVKGITQTALTPEQLLAGLGLDKTATPSQILAAIANSSLENNPAVGYLATLYLGSVIAGGSASEPIDPEAALEGLRQLMDMVAQGVPLDQAVELLTRGEFTGILDFQNQFLSGMAPGLSEFLTNLLLADSALSLSGSSLLALLAGIEGTNLDLMMGLLTALQSAQAGPVSGAGSGLEQDMTSTMNQAGQAAGAESAPGHVSTRVFGHVQATGQNLSALSFNPSTGELTTGGPHPLFLQSAGQEKQAVVLTGSGLVTLQALNLSTLTVNSNTARIFSAGESILDMIQLRENTVLTLEGGGLLRTGTFHGEGSSLLRLNGGAVVVTGQDGQTFGALALPVVLDGPVSLAAQASNVTNPAGKPLTPFDIIWKALLPGWHSITAMSLDGRQTRMSLLEGDPARLWLEKWDPSHGSPVHSLIIRGKDQSGRPQTRYAYLHWNQSTGTFEETSMYPNPFTITGGEAGRDWVYEEESHTLHILSAQVTAISGGSGTDTNQTPFSGRIVLADHIGGVELTLDGVVCRVVSGRAFDLGRENDVTLILYGGTGNYFESGAGCAGISLGEGTSLMIDCAEASKEEDIPDGILTAAGAGGGAGIGRDSGSSRDQSSRILIRGGTITATGTGGGAGIGAGKHASLGEITILGGTVTATGGTGGGAGIGGALGAPVGDIRIQGGTVAAVATHHAAAIGAGVRGECGDILITGTARIVKALGGNPGADIGACLFGGCGEVLISGAADIGRARLWTRTGIPLQMGEDTVILPQFRLSSRALRLDRLSISTPEQAQTAGAALEADQRWISQIQGVYSALYRQLEYSFAGLSSVQQYISAAGSLVRDDAVASTLLADMRQSILLQPSQAIRTHSKRGSEDVQQLLR
ncbi:MAG: hypothetical protein HFF52_05280 [Lawsonibacter sp.]|nr:hypothetical protein [Lawsonibacter sp.]